MSARCPITGSCPFRRRQAEGDGKKVAGRSLLQVLSGRDALKSDCLSTQARQPAILNALPRLRRCLALGLYWHLCLNRRNTNELAREQQAIKRLASLEDVTGALLLLTSDDAAFITGQAIVVDGAQNPVG
jgi:hypothetical protein